MKKFLSLLLSCMLCLATLALACCKNKGDESASASSSAAQQETYLELKNSNKILTLGDRVKLTASYNEMDGETLSWSSSKPDVISVDENGVVEALKVGKATITVRYGEKEATCEVESGLSGNVPVLAFNNNMREEITLMKSSEYDFGAHIRFNGKTFSDGEIEYYVQDESIATIVDGKLETKQAVGSTIVSVAATWRGQTVHTKTVKINVIEDTTVLLNDGRLQSVELYTVKEHEGSEYATSNTISSVFVSQDGTEIKDYELFIVDERIATIEKVGSTWEIKASKAGKTNLIVSFENKEIAFDVNVLRPVCETGVTLDYSISDAKYFDEASKTLKPVTEAMEGLADAISYEFNGKENKLRDGVLALPDGESCNVVLYNENAGYRVTFCAYTTVIDELKDFENIYAGEEKTEISGAYMLGKDIIEPNTVLAMPSGKVPNDFAGEFDGKGHVLSFTFDHGSEHRFGLFGEYLNGARIENLALNNVKQSGTTRRNPSGIICFAAQPNDSKKSSTIKNVYVDIEFYAEGKANLAFMYSAAWAAMMENVIIHVPTVPLSDEYGSFARGACASVSNSYVISSAVRYKDLETNPVNINSWIKMQPILYADYNAMKSAGNDYSSFSADCWDVTTYDVPVWKSLVEDFVL